MFRLFRVVRVVRLLREVGPRRFFDAVLRDRASSALLVVIFLALVLLEFGSALILAIEIRAPDGNITNASDALWYTYVTVTTVGYGDHYPVTNAGRVVGVLIMTVGVGLFGTLTGFLANAFVTPKKDDPAPAAAARATPRCGTSWPRSGASSTALQEHLGAGGAVRHPDEAAP